MSNNISYIPGPMSETYIAPTGTPGVDFVGNDLYHPLNALKSPYQDHIIMTPGVPANYGSLTEKGTNPPAFFYPSDIAAPSPDVGCIKR